MIDLNAMALFAKIVECESFSVASKRMGVPISTISRKLTQLEKALGVRLIERSTRKLRMTELGQEYYGYCRRAMQEIESANQMIHARQNDVAGTLRITVPPSLEQCLVLPLVSGFQRKYPKVRVRVWVTQQYINFIDDDIDLALRVGELQDSSLVARQLLVYRHVLVAAPRYLATAGVPEHPSQLKDHRLICFADRYGQAVWTFTNDTEVEKLVVEGVLALNDFVGLQSAAQANLGITELPSIMCAKALADGSLVEVLPGWSFSPLSTASIALHAVYPSNRNLPRLVRLFKDYCVEHIDAVVRAAGH